MTISNPNRNIKETGSIELGPSFDEANLHAPELGDVVSESTDCSFEGPSMPAEVISPDEVRERLEELFNQQTELAVESTGTDEAVIPSIISPPAANGVSPLLQKSEPLITRIKGRLSEVIDQRGARKRAATEADIDTLVEVDIAAFDSVYREYDTDTEKLREELKEKFAGRLEKVGGDWIQVFERDGQIAGFIACCPTNKTPEEFESWEQTTDNGTLETTYDPNGKYIYVVSLSMIPEGSSIKGQNMLFGDQIGKFIQEGYEQAFFESRVPGLRLWVARQCREKGKDVAELSDAERDELANAYFGLKTEVNGKEVPKDRLLRMYDSIGCDLIKIVPNAYRDEPSMDYGVVCVFRNPLPEFLRKNRLASKAIGSVIRFAANSRKLSERLF